MGLLEHAGRSIKDLAGICLASVVPQLTQRVALACHEYLKQEPLIVDTGIKTGRIEQNKESLQTLCYRIVRVRQILGAFAGVA